MDSYVRFVGRHRKPLLALFLILNITALVGLFRISINPDFEIFTATESRSQAVLDEMNAKFQNSEQLLFLVEMDGTELSAVSWSRWTGPSCRQRPFRNSGAFRVTSRAWPMSAT